MAGFGLLTCFRRYVYGLAPKPADGDDAALLERFVQGRDDTAFAALVARHGPLVLSVCRRVVGHEQDAEDALQATFLVLARRASSIRTGQALASWLYQVAYRIACHSRAESRRRQNCLREIPMSTVSTSNPASALVQAESLAALDRELMRLSEKDRAILVLCDLQGQTHEAAARTLGCPVGSISYRLSQARDLLRKRLTRDGLAPAGGLAALVTAAQQAQAALGPARAFATVQAALAFVGLAAGDPPSGPVLALAKGALHSMSLTTMRFALACVLTVATLGASGVVLAHHALDEGNAPARAQQLPIAQKGEGKKPEPKAPPHRSPGTWKEDLSLAPAPTDMPDVLWPTLALSTDGQRLAMRVGDFLTIHDLAGKKLLAQRNVPTGDGFALAFARKGSAFAASDGTGLTVWDRPGSKKAIRLEWGSDLTPLGDGANAGPAGVVGVQLNTVRAATFSLDHTLLATGSDSGKIKLWKVGSLWRNEPASKKALRVLKGDASGVLCLAFGPGAKRLAVGHGDGSLTVWDVAAGTKLAFFPPPTGPAPKAPELKKEALPAAQEGGGGAPESAFVIPRSLCFSASGHTLAVVDSRGLRLLEVASQKEISRLGWDEERKANRQVLAAVFSTERNKLAVGWEGGAIKIFDLAGWWQSGRRPAPESAGLRADRGGSSSHVAALAFSADSRVLASYSGLGQVRVWKYVPSR
jgi:RNA polymerase sigma factor (sigma-70 family)